MEHTRKLTPSQDGKSGLDDCMQDDEVRISTEQDVTQTATKLVSNTENILDTNKHDERGQK